MELTKDKVKEYVEQSLAKYSSSQQQQVLAQLPYMQFDSEDELKEELLQYLYYYNHERHHQGIGDTPINFRNLLPN